MIALFSSNYRMPRRKNHHDASAAAITTSSSSAPQPSSEIKKRAQAQPGSSGVAQAVSSNMEGSSRSDEGRPLLDGGRPSNENGDDISNPSLSWVGRNQWIVFALASGACAAFNGVFAKLTTTELTTSFATGIAKLLQLSDFGNVIEVIVRSMFFGLNLVFNGVMWTLFTKALTKGNSTTQVSIINTSSNFVITAILGVAIFSESLPPLWWLGASMLVAGNVIIGQKDEGGSKSGESMPESSSPPTSPESTAEDGQGTYHRIPGVEEPVFIPRDHEKDENEDVLDINVEGSS
ncbi:hypothetical protein V8F20_005487 [Naviculisporaceae sp. PSN 640]